MRVVYTGTKTAISIEDQPLASAGGEGTVYKVTTAGFPNCCVKIYHQHKITASRKSKIDFMVKNKPQVIITPSYVICWPTEMIFDRYNNFIGFLMPLAFGESEKLYVLTTIRISKKLTPDWNKYDRTLQTGMENRLKICANIANAIDGIHKNGKYIMVDYKPQNILITKDGKISVIDVDSFQISNNGSVLFYSEVATPEYAPPESAKINPSKSLVAESWDRFSLAVSFYEILFGIHPFASTCDGQFAEITTIDGKIQNGLFVHGSKKSSLKVVPAVHNNFNNLPISISQLFFKALEYGNTNDDERPSAKQWIEPIVFEVNNKIGIKPNIVSIPIKQRLPLAPVVPPYKPVNVRSNNASGNLNGGTPEKENIALKIFIFLLIVFAVMAIIIAANKQ